MAAAAIAALNAATEDVSKEYTNTLRRHYVHDDGNVHLLALGRRMPCTECKVAVVPSPLPAYQPVNWPALLRSKTRAYRFEHDAGAALCAAGFQEEGFTASILPLEKGGRPRVRMEGCCKKTRKGINCYKEHDLSMILLDLLKCRCDLSNRWMGGTEFIFYIKDKIDLFEGCQNRVARFYSYFSCQRCSNKSVCYDIVAFCMKSAKDGNIFCLEIKVAIDFRSTFLTLGKKNMICC
eukprot:Selendium_serpulae@DN5818_c0_g1_i2.p1